jgi:hypothetical protein
MKTIMVFLILVVLILAVTMAWQIGSAEIANMNLREDMHDLASQAGTHVGFVTPSSDEEVSNSVIRRAKEHGIELQPSEVTVRRINPGEHSTLYIAADYKVATHVLALSFNLHFTPSSDK